MFSGYIWTQNPRFIIYLGFRSNVPHWSIQKSSPEGLEGSLLISAKIETMWSLQGGFQYLKYSIFFHRSSLFCRWGLNLEAWAFWTIRTCLNPYHIDQILENQFFSKTAHPKIYPQPRISCMDLMEACCTGIFLAHSLWEFCSWGRRCTQPPPNFLKLVEGWFSLSFSTQL